MKNTIRIGVIVFCLVSFLIHGKLIAQSNKLNEDSNYTNAIGLRFGRTSGITVKHKLANKNAIEVILGMFPYSFGVTGLYEWYHQTNEKGLSVYYGGGLGVARAYDHTEVTYYNNFGDNMTYVKTYGYGPIFGFNAIGGIEYKIPRTPLAVSFDLKPYAEFFNNYGPYIELDPGLQIKLTF